jgi:hypothetical protein
LPRHLKTRGVELLEEAEAIIQEDSCRDVATEDAAIARVNEVEVSIVIEISKSQSHEKSKKPPPPRT